MGSRWAHSSTGILYGIALSAAVLHLSGCLPSLDPALLDEPDSGDANDSLCVSGLPNGWIEGNEQCDDGNVIEGDGCTKGCRIECAGLLDPRTGHCYELINQSASPGEAVGACTQRGNGSHVVTIRSDVELDLVTNWARQQGIERMLLGLYADNDLKTWRSVGPREPGWKERPACPGCYARWAPGEPVTTILNRIAQQPTGQDRTWHTWSFREPIPLVCERPLPGRPQNLCHAPSCDPAQTYIFEWNQHLYRVEKSAQTAWSAEQICRDWGGHLTSIDDEPEREMLASLGPGTRFWIGLVRKAAGTPWRWMDGKTVEERPVPWSAAGPNNKGTVGTLAPSTGFDTFLVTPLTPTVPLPYVCKK